MIANWQASKMVWLVYGLVCVSICEKNRCAWFLVYLMMLAQCVLRRSMYDSKLSSLAAMLVMQCIHCCWDARKAGGHLCLPYVVFGGSLLAGLVGGVGASMVGFGCCVILFDSVE